MLVVVVDENDDFFTIDSVVVVDFLELFKKSRTLRFDKLLRKLDDDEDDETGALVVSLLSLLESF